MSGNLRLGQDRLSAQVTVQIVSLVDWIPCMTGDTTMTSCRKKVVIRLVFWVVAEISLNAIGIDDLADYSEFIFEKRSMVPPVNMVV